MRTCLALAFCLVQWVACAANVAQVRMYCVSVRMLQGRDQFGDTLYFTSTGMMDAGLGDFAPWQVPGSELQLPGSDSYISNISLYDPVSGTYGGSIAFSIPAPVDENQNGFPDFFEVSRGVDTNRPYGNMSLYGVGQINLLRSAWLRQPGSSIGSWQFVPDDDYFGTFRGVFELLEYTGTMTYTPGANSISATLNVTQTGRPTNTLQATLQFRKSESNAYNEMTLEPGISSGALLSTVHSFTNHVFTRDPAWPTNFAGYIEFSDGDPYTFEPYANWVLAITDTADYDHDGIPDFSDDPVVLPPPRAAELTLVPEGAGLNLIIRGDVGRDYQIQSTGLLETPDWLPVQTVTLASDPQTFPLPVPTATRFWRVVAQYQ